ncbi:MAG TPA: MaoC family dehydratase [Usitatibacteraceae bacterium]|nr:MaoC family dehydratase [Usitatibacteraceae bacterium]
MADRIARPLAGFFFDDYAIGQHLAHATPRTVTQADATLHLALTGSRNPVHCAAPVAAALGHRAVPLDDLLVFHVAFGKTVHDVSFNAVANLGYADLRFLAPVYPGDTLSARSEVIGLKENSSGKTGVVWVRSRAFNQDGAEVLSWVRWVMVARNLAVTASGKEGPAIPAPAAIVPHLPREVTAGRLSIPAFLDPRALDPRATGGTRWWDDYAPGETIDHPGAMTIEEADHMLATRLYQNTARVHFDALAARGTAFGRRLVYGGHVISLCRALAHDGLENAFAIAAIHGGAHANPTFAGDTIVTRTVIHSRDEIPARADVGALRVRMLGAKNVKLADLATPAPGAGDPAVVLDLDLTLLVPRRA